MPDDAGAKAPDKPLKVTLDQQVCFAVYGAAHAFNRAYKPILQPLGLTYPQYLVLLILWEQDCQSVKTIGDRLGLDSGTLSPLLKRLEQAGRIKRRRADSDERQVLVSLTDEGAALKLKAETIVQSIGKATGCTKDYLVDLRDGLNKLRCNLEKTAGQD